VQSISELGGNGLAFPKIKQPVQPSVIQQFWNQLIKIDHCILCLREFMDAPLNIIPVAKNSDRLIN
jgi:hypothetical protein